MRHLHPHILYVFHLSFFTERTLPLYHEISLDAMSLNL